MTTYEVTDNFILRTNEDGSRSFIPKDETNADYQAYLNKDTSNSSTPQAGN